MGGMVSHDRWHCSFIYTVIGVSLTGTKLRLYVTCLMAQLQSGDSQQPYLLLLACTSECVSVCAHVWKWCTNDSRWSSRPVCVGLWVCVHVYIFLQLCVWSSAWMSYRSWQWAVHAVPSSSAPSTLPTVHVTYTHIQLVIPRKNQVIWGWVGYWSRQGCTESLDQSVCMCMFVLVFRSWL